MNMSPYATYPPPVMSHESEEEVYNESDQKTFIALGKTIVTKVGDLSRVGNIKIEIALKDDVMDSHEVCEYLKISPKQLYNLRRNYGLPGYRPTGKPLYFRRSEVDAWLDRCGLTF